MNKQYKTAAMAAIHETALGMHEANMIPKETMKTFDEMCLTPVKELTPEERGDQSQSRLRAVRYDAPPRPMTVEEYAQLDEPEDGYRYELVQGRMVVQEPGPGYPQAFVHSRLVWRLGNWTSRTGRGDVAVEMDCIVSANPATVRRPDIAVFIEPKPWEDTPGNWAQGSPEIAIEILSPSNRPGEMRDKIRDYFGGGALRIWIVDPKSLTVIIHQADGSETIFREGDRLVDPEVLPGFAVEVGELF